MITYFADQRGDATVQARNTKIDDILDLLTGNSVVAAMLGGVTNKVVFTTLKPDDTAIEGTGVVSRANVALDEPNGAGLDYSLTAGIGQTNFDTWLLVNPTFVDADGADFVTFSGPTKLSLTRILFHELTHLSLDWERTSEGTQFEEELAIFSENTIYRKFAQGLNFADKDSIRYGHEGIAWNGVGVSGVGSFEPYVQSSSATIAIDRSRTDGTKATFVAQDGAYTLTKTFWNGSHGVDYYFYDHYITLTEEVGLGTYITNGYVNSQRVDRIVGDLMHGNVNGGISSALAASTALTSLPGSHTVEISRITGLGADATTLNQIVGSGANAVETAMIYVGVANPGQTSRPATIAIDDTTSNRSTLLVGAAGYGGVAGGKDDLHAGSGNDIVLASGLGDNDIFGNGGHDILVGTIGLDHLYGGTGDDILIGGAGQNYLDGGTDAGGGDIDTAYYGDRPQGIVVYDGLTRVDHDGVIDTVLNIERYVGTTLRDTFVGNGQGHVFIGNGGGDRFLAATGGDTFIGTGTSTARADEVSFEALPGSVNINVTAGTTTQGHSFGYVASIVGSAQGDTFTATGATGIFSLYGGAGNDTFTVGAQAKVYGGDNDDVINLTSVVFSVIDGGNNNDTVNYVGFSTGVNFNTNSFSSIETFNTTGYADVITADTLATIAFNTGDGNDIIYANQGVSLINGGIGFDTVTYENSFAAITIRGLTGQGGAAGDTYANIERIAGSNFADTFKGGIGEFWGGNGNDFFIPGGFGTFHGEGGTDVIDFSGFGSAINFNFASTTIGGQAFDGIERVNGTAFGDTLTGTSANQDFFGGAGSDTITGGGGYDRYFLDGDKTVGDGDPDVMRVRKINDVGGAFHYDVDVTYDSGAHYQTDHLYGISAMILPDGSSLAFPASVWINPYFT